MIVPKEFKPREIKFRAWDKRESRMIIDEQAFIPVKVTNKGVLRLSPRHKEELWEFIKGDRFEVMQYTGLKDRNGKEVYEGDIVKCSSGFPHEVYWENECGGTYVGGIPAFYLSGILRGYAWSGDEEVIGNIHEHPHLLKGEEA